MNIGERKEAVNQQVQGGSTALGRGSRYDGAMRNTLKTMVIVVIVFFICWTPNECLWGLQYVGLITIDFTSWIYGFSTFVQYSHCFVNPLIYVIKYKEFRLGYARMVSKILPPKQPGVYVRPKTEGSNDEAVSRSYNDTKY
jgi:hypothetical protein